MPCSAPSSLLQPPRFVVIAATYDRMLHSVGHDQRFGTQFGPAGLQRVDSIGICDAERLALGCRTLDESHKLTLKGSVSVPKPTGS